MNNSICLVATYKEFAQLARDLKKELDLPIDVLEGSLEEGTKQALVAKDLLWPLIVPHCRLNCWKASYSAMWKAPSLEQKEVVKSAFLS